MKPGTTANQITAELLVKLSERHDCIAWRNNTGKGLGWSVVKAVIACLRRRDIDAALTLLTRPISFGLIGSPDVVGLISPFGRWIGFEVKVDDDQSPAQIAFELRCKALGGVYIVCRSVAVALEELDLELGRAA